MRFFDLAVADGEAGLLEQRPVFFGRIEKEPRGTKRCQQPGKLWRPATAVDGRKKVGTEPAGGRGLDADLATRPKRLGEVGQGQGRLAEPLKGRAAVDHVEFIVEGHLVSAGYLKIDAAIAIELLGLANHPLSRIDCHDPAIGHTPKFSRQVAGAAANVEDIGVGRDFQ